MDGYEDLVGSDRMWVRLGEAWSGDPTLRWRIVGNGHTHRGRITVEPIGTSDPPVNISLGDVVDCSAEAKIWLNGFLAGQEAELNEFLGREVDQVSALEIERWQDWNASWRRTGHAPSLQRQPAAVEVPENLGPPLPWIYIAGDYRVCENGAWRPAAPQPAPYASFVSPARDGWAWPGSLCEARRHHALVAYGELSVCDDCHHVST